MREYEGVNIHTPKATPTFGDEVPVDSQNSKSDCKGQTSMSCGVIYIIGKLLKCKCLKWAPIHMISALRSQCAGQGAVGPPKRDCSAGLFERSAGLYLLTFFTFCYFLLLFLLLVSFVSYFLLLKGGGGFGNWVL